MARVSAARDRFLVAAQSTAKETRKIAVAFAKREHARIMATPPKPASYLRVVDGVRGAPEEAVKVPGRIVYHYSRLADVVDYAMRALVMLSPRDSGEYANSHTLFVNGVAVPNLDGEADAREIFISNPLPYSRIIELGKMTMRVPGTDHVYERAERVVSQRYGRVASVKFTFRAVVGGEMVPYVAGGSNRAERAALRQQPARQSAIAMEREARVPALWIRALY